jgi:hypothetical protein
MRNCVTYTSHAVWTFKPRRLRQVGHVAKTGEMRKVLQNFGGVISWETSTLKTERKMEGTS